MNMKKYIGRHIKYNGIIYIWCCCIKEYRVFGTGCDKIKSKK
jgi:hypothetical protein